MKIKIEPFLMKQGIRVGRGAIEFESQDSFLAGWHLVGFTICDDPEKGLYVMFPATLSKKDGEATKAYYILRPGHPAALEHLEKLILDKYEDMVDGKDRVKKEDKPKV